MNIVRITIIYSILLIVLGLGGYFMSDAASITALIPAFFGVAILLAGLVGMKQQHKKLAMHIAATLGLLGFIGTASALADFFSLISGEEVTRQMSVVVKSIMAVLSLAYVLTCVKSFIDARRSAAL